MLNKRFFGESVLSEQTWYRADESTATVAQFLKDQGIELSTTPGTRSPDAWQPRFLNSSAHRSSGASC